MDRAKGAWDEASPILYVTAAIITVLGGGALSGLIAALIRPKPAGIDEVVTVADAFQATWPMSLALSIIVIAAMAGAVTKMGPYGALLAVAVILWVAVYLAFAQTSTTTLDPSASAPFSPAVQLPPLGSPPQNARAILLAFDQFLLLYGSNVFAGGAAGAGVGLFAFEYSAKLKSG